MARPHRKGCDQDEHSTYPASSKQRPIEKVGLIMVGDIFCRLFVLARLASVLPEKVDALFIGQLCVCTIGLVANLSFRPKILVEFAHTRACTHIPQTWCAPVEKFRHL